MNDQKIIAEKKIRVSAKSRKSFISYFAAQNIKQTSDDVIPRLISDYESGHGEVKMEVGRCVML